MLGFDALGDAPLGDDGEDPVSASLVGVGSVAAVPSADWAGAATLQGAGSATATGGRVHAGSASLVGSGSLTAVGGYDQRGSASLAGSGALAAVPVKINGTTASLIGAGSLTAEGGVEVADWKQIFRCLSWDDLRDQALALLPRGRAWQTHDGGPRPGSVLHGYWSAVTMLSAFLTHRLCALRMEFWCATHEETHPEWLKEYGLPDTCDPFPDLCAKVKAIGGTRCEYYAEVAERAGWEIECDDSNSALAINVLLDESPSYVRPSQTPPIAGLLQAGLALGCDPDITPLKCVLDRVVHAHIQITYTTVGG